MSTNLLKLPEPEIAQRLTALPGWQRAGETITKEFIFPGFTEATQFIAKLAGPANAMDHHPDVQLYFLVNNPLLDQLAAIRIALVKFVATTVHARLFSVVD